MLGQKEPRSPLFKAEQTATLVGQDVDRIGEQDRARWRHIAAVCRQLGVLTDDALPPPLIWDANDASKRRWLIPLLLILSGVAIATLLVYRNSQELRATSARLGGLAPFCQDRAAKTEPDHFASLHRPQRSRSRFHPGL
jgi:hypothetical protein